MPTIALPKATVQLPTAKVPAVAVAGAASAPAAAEEDDGEVEEKGAGLAKMLTLVCFIAACAVLALQLMTANVWISAEDNSQSGQWGQLFSSDP